MSARLWLANVPPACAVHPCVCEAHARLRAAPGSRAALAAVAAGKFAAPLLASGALGMRVTSGHAATLDMLLLDAAKRLCLPDAPLLFVRPGAAPDVLYLALPADVVCGDERPDDSRVAAAVVSSAALATYSHREMQAAMAAALSAHVAGPAHALATIATATTLAIVAPDVLAATLPAEARAVWAAQARALLRETLAPVQLSGDRCALLVAQDVAVVRRVIVKSRSGGAGALGQELTCGDQGAAACTGGGALVDVADLRLRELDRWARSEQFATAMANALPPERASGASEASS